MLLSSMLVSSMLVSSMLLVFGHAAGHDARDDRRRRSDRTGSRAVARLAWRPGADRGQVGAAEPPFQGVGRQSANPGAAGGHRRDRTHAGRRLGRARAVAAPAR